MGTGNPVEELEAALAALVEESDIATFVARCATGPEDPALPRVDMFFSRFREDSPDTEALAEFLSSQIVNYVVPLKKRREAIAIASTAAGGADISVVERLNREAKRKFIEFDDKNPGRASEVGELIAYLVAQKWLGAFQVASKMALKTSFNMPVHGLDGIHAKFEGGVMTLYFLESKLSESSQKGIADFCESTGVFAGKRKQYLLEYSIISDLSNLESLSDADRLLALQYLDVYGEKKAQRLERSVGVVCYSENLFNTKLEKSDTTTPQQHEDHFAEIYGDRKESIKEAFAVSLTKNSLDSADCRVMLVAVPDKNKLRELFSKGAGA